MEELVATFTPVQTKKVLRAVAKHVDYDTCRKLLAWAAREAPEVVTEALSREMECMRKEFRYLEADAEAGEWVSNLNSNNDLS